MKLAVSIDPAAGSGRSIPGTGSPTVVAAAVPRESVLAYQALAVGSFEGIPGTGFVRSSSGPPWASGWAESGGDSEVVPFSAAIVCDVG